MECGDGEMNKNWDYSRRLERKVEREKRVKTDGEVD